MNPVTHLFVGWSVANLDRTSSKTRAAIMLASVVPDLDGVGIIVDWATASSASPTSLYSDYHHVLGHNLLAAILVASGCAVLAGEKKALIAALGFLSFHLHLLGDLLGSKGPDGSQWEIVYLWPFSRAVQLRVDWQWELNAWPNVTLTISLLAMTGYWAWRRGFSFLEALAPAADKAFVGALRQRFGQPQVKTR